MNGDTVLRLVDEVNPVHRPFEKPKDQFHVPPIGIQEHDLKGGEVASVSQKQELGGAHAETDTSVALSKGVIVTDDEAVGDVLEERLSGEGDVHREARRDVIFQIRLHAEDQVGLRMKDVLKKLERDISSIGDIRDASGEHLSQGMTLTGLAGANQDINRNHAIQFKAQMQFEGLGGRGILGPLYDRHGGKE